MIFLFPSVSHQSPLLEKPKNMAYKLYQTWLLLPLKSRSEHNREQNNSEQLSQLSREQRRVCDCGSSTQSLTEHKVFAITALPQLQCEQLPVQKLG